MAEVVGVLAGGFLKEGEEGILMGEGVGILMGEGVRTLMGEGEGIQKGDPHMLVGVLMEDQELD